MDKRQPEEISAVLQKAITKLTSPHLQSELHAGMAPPVRERRNFQTESGDAQGDLWIFYTIPGHRVALAYSEEGYGALGMRWGLVFIHSDQYGMSGSWYYSLGDLLWDSGYFESD